MIMCERGRNILQKMQRKTATEHSVIWTNVDVFYIASICIRCEKNLLKMRHSCSSAIQSKSLLSRLDVQPDDFDMYELNWLPNNSDEISWRSKNNWLGRLLHGSISAWFSLLKKSSVSCNTKVYVFSDSVMRIFGKMTQEYHPPRRIG